MAMHLRVSAALVETMPDGPLEGFTIAEFAHIEVLPGMEDSVTNGITAAAVFDRVFDEGKDAIGIQVRAAIERATDADMKHTRRRAVRPHRG